MRITHTLMIKNAIRHIQENQELLASLQERAGANKAFSVPSDNPHAASQALSIHSSLRLSAGHLDTANNLDSWLDANEEALLKMTSVANRAIALVTSGLNDAYGADERKDLGNELELLVNEAIDTANSTHMGNYLFSGFKTHTRPFSLASGVVNYAGDSGQMQREVAREQTITANIDGEAALRPMLEALTHAQTALQTNDTDTLRGCLDEIKAGLDAVNQHRAVNGSRQRQAQSVIATIEKTQLELKGLLSQKADANMAEAVTLLSNQETTYQAVLEVAQRAISTAGLFDVLR